MAWILLFPVQIRFAGHWDKTLLDTLSEGANSIARDIEYFVLKDYLVFVLIFLFSPSIDTLSVIERRPWAFYFIHRKSIDADLLKLNLSKHKSKNTLLIQLYQDATTKKENQHYGPFKQFVGNPIASYTSGLNACQKARESTDNDDRTFKDSIKQEINLSDSTDSSKHRNPRSIDSLFNKLKGNKLIDKVEAYFNQEKFIEYVFLSYFLFLFISNRSNSCFFF